MLSISNKNKKFWAHYITQSDHYDPRWEKRTRRLSYSRRQKEYDNILINGSFPADIWKVAVLLDQARKSNEKPYATSRTYSCFCLSKSRDMRKLLFDYSMADSELIQQWFQRHINAVPDFSTVRQLSDMGMRPIRVEDLEKLVKDDQDSIIQHLNNKKLISINTLRQAAAKFEKNNMPLYRLRIDAYLPTDEQIKGPETPPPKKNNPPMAQTHGQDISWHKVDHHTISRIQNLPDGLRAQDIFNFHAEDIRHIISSQTNQFAASQTIRNFNDVARAETLSEAAKQLSDLGGDPDPHKLKKARAKTPPAPNA